MLLAVASGARPFDARASDTVFGERTGTSGSMTHCGMMMSSRLACQALESHSEEKQACRPGIRTDLCTSEQSTASRAQLCSESSRDSAGPG